MFVLQNKFSSSGHYIDSETNVIFDVQDLKIIETFCLIRIHKE